MCGIFNIIPVSYWIYDDANAGLLCGYHSAVSNSADWLYFLFISRLFVFQNESLSAGSLITGEFCIILDICAEFCLLNFPAAIFLLFGSLQSFQRNQSNVITFIQEVKKQHLQKQVAGCFSAYAIMLFSIFWILNSFS